MRSLRIGLVLAGIAALTVLVAALIMAAPGSYLRENIINPLSYALWIVSLLLRGTPQVVFWGIFLMIAVVLALRSLAAASHRPVHPQPMLISYPHRARLRYWVRQLLLSQDDRAVFQLKDSLGRLALDILSYQRGLTPSQYQQQLDSGQLETPEALIPFLEARKKMFAPKDSFNLQDLRRWFERTLDKLPFLPHPSSAVNSDVAHLVEFLEEQMDVE